MSIKGVIFDLDGVITDTALFHYQAWKKIANKWAYNLSLEENEKLKGVSRLESLNLILSWCGTELSSQEKEAVLEEKNQHYLKLIATLSERDILPGVVSFLDELDLFSCLKAVGSSSKNALPILEKLQLRPRFNVLIDGTHVTRSKPDPEVFLRAAEQLNLKASECVVIEDAPAGILAAKSAKMKCIGVGSELLLADLVVPNLSGLKFEQLHKL
jgi:beta-phosphoglucomutase